MEHAHEENLFEQIGDHLTFILVTLLITAAIVVLAKIAENLVVKKTGKSLSKWTTKKIAGTGVCAAVGGVLMIIEIPVFLFYNLDLSEVAGMMAGFLFGPVAAVIVEFIKPVIHILLHGTHSMFVGEFAAFVTGCSYVLPAAFIYLVRKNKKGALLGLGIGTLCLTVIGSLFNAFYLIPKFADLYGMDIPVIVSMGSELVPGIKSLWSFVGLATAPFNLLKGAVVSVIVFIIYKPLSNLYRKIG